MLSIVELGQKKELLAVCAKDERAADGLQISKKNLEGGQWVCISRQSDFFIRIAHI